MKIGEIKAQALMLMYPFAQISFNDSDDEAINKSVYELKADPNYRSLLEASVGAINRAFSLIEERGLSTQKCVDIGASACQRVRGKASIEKERELLRVERVLLHKDNKTYAPGYEEDEKYIYAPYARGVYTIVYKTKIPRITSTTRDSYDAELPYGLGEILPYFVASELAVRENGELSKELKSRFEELVSAKEAKAPHCEDCFQIIYQME